MERGFVQTLIDYMSLLVPANLKVVQNGHDTQVKMTF